jgi:pSer/pThr/pTyr-binding forkhead associated (FHA) protein
MEIILLVLRFLLAAALYAFLGWAFWLLWQELRRTARQTGALILPALTLSPLEGASARSWRFIQPEVLVGRETGSDCRLEDSAISSRHARLAYRQGQWWVEDLGSRNGTFLNQERLTQPLVLASGDELRFGGVILRVAIEPVPEPYPTGGTG